MPKNLELDLTNLNNVANPIKTDSNRIKFASTQKRFSSIGFDLYRDDQSEFIWRLEKDAESGEEFIIRTAEKDPAFKNKQGWTALANTGRSSITLAYKGQAIKQFKQADVGFEDQELDQWRQFLVEKISTDPKFLKQVLTQVGEQRRKYIFSQFPELK